MRQTILTFWLLILILKQIKNGFFEWLEGAGFE
jgi:hypothetical protein